eukprot:CAMPEP_0168821830 /NCGR_PEP_ID=MMETSP0726-20121227/9622_1 /TAXON_ID=265536 /ORGANISM="Amphiprora sp., Strain CCMP467" /LENGTH=46 /DNA_ID= /DNA_START= /DNA_END= /DNA_ORIENTATION=
MAPALSFFFSDLVIPSTSVANFFHALTDGKESGAADELRRKALAKR